MIKVQAIEDFTLNDFDKIMELKRSSSKNKEGSLFVGDTFECTEEMYKYLTGTNDKGITVVKIIEVIPKKEEPKEKVIEEPKKEYTPKKKKHSKK